MLKPIPKALPIFQLKNNIINKTSEVFRTVNEFLAKLEVILEAHDMSLDQDCGRCMLATMSREQLSWFTESVRGKGYTKKQAMDAFKKKYGASTQSAALVTRLHKMQMQESQDGTDYADKFQSLMCEAGESDNVTLSSIFLNSLTSALAKAARMTHLAHPDPKPKLNVARIAERISSLDSRRGLQASSIELGR